MNDSIKRISLDIHKVSSSETVNAKRGDTGRTIHISLVDGGVPYIISKDCYAVFTAKKPDGKVVYNDCTIENNTIIYEITEQTVAVEGKLNCEIKLYGADEKLITSSKFTICVFGTVYNEGDEVESSDEFNALTQMVGYALEAKETANEAAEKAYEAADKAAQTAKSLMVVGKAEGTVIPLVDAIKQFLVGLRIFGKTTQDGTPTPEAPVELVSAGDGGSVSVFVSGKNLLDLSNFTDRNVTGVTITNNRNGSVTLVSDGTYDRYYNGSVLVSIPSGRYKLVEPSSSRAAFVRVFPKGETTYKQYNAGVEFEYDNSTHELRFLVQYDPGTVINTTFWPMLCLATETDENYEPYKAQKLTISTPDGMPGIPVTSGGNYTDANGQQWICDEIDLARGVYVQRVCQETITSKAVLSADKQNLATGGMEVSVSLSKNNLVNANISTIISNRAKGVSLDKRTDNENIDAYRCYTVQAPGTFIFRYPRSVGEKTLEEAKSDFSGAVVQYILATPIETPLSEEELAAYASLHTYRNTTTVTNDAGAYMELEYVMDAKKYIDSLVISGGASARIANVTILASAWKTESESLHSQVVNIAGVTEYSKVDLLPSVEQLAIFRNKDVAFVTENEDGVVTVYAIGDKPTQDYTMQVSITEVVV